MQPTARNRAAAKSRAVEWANGRNPVSELLKAAKDANNRDVNPTAFFLAAVIYLILTFVLTLLSQWCEKRFSRHEQKEA